MSNMGPDLEVNGKSDISREANKEPVSVMKGVENNHMNNTINVGTSHQTEGAFINMDSRVNMLEGKKSSNINQVEVKEEIFDEDLTESSSSFDSDGISFNDAEDDLELFDDAISGFTFDGYNELFQVRKKKLALSWRKHVEPLRWRCKWVELQIRKFELQAQKYESEIAECDRRELFGNSKSESQSQKEAVMKRKKRRRVEDTEDISSYMSRHNLFSYFENKNSTADAGGTDGNLGNQGRAGGAENIGNRVKEEYISHEFKGRGNFLEQFCWNIGVNQWQLREMRTRVHKVLSENASIFSFNENSAENPPSPLENDDEILQFSNEIVYEGGDSKMNDVAMLESEALKLGENVSVDNESLASPAIGGSSRNPTGTILIYNRRSKMNRNKSKEVNTVSSQKPQKSTEDNQASTSNDPSNQVPEPSPPKMISLSKMMANTTGNTSFKRKRATRKAGKWNQ